MFPDDGVESVLMEGESATLYCEADLGSAHRRKVRFGYTRAGLIGVQIGDCLVHIKLQGSGPASGLGRRTRNLTDLVCISFCSNNRTYTSPSFIPET